MCLLKGDIVPLTLSQNAFLIWDANRGAKLNSLWVVAGGGVWLDLFTRRVENSDITSYSHYSRGT